MQLKTKAILFSSMSQTHKAKKETFSFISNNAGLLFLCAFLLAGMIFGALSAHNANADMLDKMDFIFANNFKIRATQSLSVTFSAALASSFLLVFITMMMGLSLWGTIFIPVVPFFKGFGAGFSAGYLYAFYGWKGILFNLIVMLPGIFLSSLAVVLSAREAIRFSKNLAMDNIQKKNREKQYPSLKRYFFRNGVVLIMLAAAALLDMIFTALFSGFFSF